MSRRIVLAILSAVLALAAWTPAQAQIPIEHTWVASNGNDNNNCDRPTPCASFSSAINKTLPGGEISCVDNGNFAANGFVINRSITVNCETAIASSAGPSVTTPSVTIFSGPNDIVILRGLDIDGGSLVGGNFPLISFSGSGTLRLEKMRIASTRTGAGVLFAPTNGAAKLHISDSYIVNNIAAGLTAGVKIVPAAGIQATVTIERTVVDNNTFGIFADGTSGGTIRGVVKDSVVSGNSQNGISVNTAGANAALLVDNSTISGNNFGLAVGGSHGLILVRRSSITANNTGLQAGGGGSLVTYRDNVLNNNTTDGAFSFAIGTQ